MINYIRLFEKIQRFRVTNDTDLPFAYQRANPQGRPFHNDWTIPWLPSVIQPWGKIPRICTAYRLPMPAKQIAGNVIPHWIPVQAGYPLVPDTEIKIMDYYDGTKTIKTPYIMAVDPYLKVGEWSRQAVWVDGEWIECYHAATRMLFGRKLNVNVGLRPDITLGDFLWWFPEAGLQWTK